MAAYIGNKRFQLTTALNGLGGPAQWGDITGQISAQADLQQEFQEVSALIMTEGIQQLNGIVKNGKMTIYQGNVEKGQFSANQSSDLSIFLDTPSPGGGGDIPADLSCNNLSVGTSVSLGLGSTASGDGSIAQGSFSKATAGAAVALGSLCQATAQMSYAIGYQAKAINNNSMVLALTDSSGLRNSNGDNSLNIYVGDGQSSNNALNSILVNGWGLKDHIEGIIQNTPGQQQLYFRPFDPTNGHSQEGSNIYIGNSYLYQDKGIICFILKFGYNAPFILEWQDPITYNTVQEELRISNNDSSTTEVTQIFVVPCAFNYGVNIRNDFGYSMKVDELFTIELLSIYN